MEPINRTHNLIRLLIVLTFAALGVTYGLVVPPFENLDELEHFEVVRYIANTGRLPVHGAADGGEYHYRQEASQPPLYHLLSAGLVRLLHLPTEAPTLRPNPYVACGPHTSALFDNRATLYHDPAAEAFPWRGPLLTLHILRLWSTLLQTFTVLGTYALARDIFPTRPTIRLLAMGIVAFNPQFLLVASDVSNDNLVTPLATWALHLLLHARRDGLTVRRAALLGGAIGLAGLAKLSGWLLLPMTVPVLIGLLIDRRTTFGNLFTSGLVLAAVSGLLSAWWFGRNWHLYGDLTALSPMLSLVGLRTTPIHPLYETLLMFKSFWGQIPCSFYPRAFYVPYAFLTAGGLIGAALAWRRLSVRERQGVSVLIGWFLLVVGGWIRWDMLTPAPGGRLLFPALPSLALLLAFGIGKRWRLPVGASLLGLSVVSVFLMSAFFAPPRRYRATSPPPMEHPLDARFGDSIHLRGYDLSLDRRSPTLDTILYWQTSAPLAEDYVLALQLVSPKPGDTALRLNYNSWPGRGNYPTSAWQPGDIIADRYRLHLEDSTAYPTQGWNLSLALYRQESGERLPVHLGGNPAGDMLVLTTMRVPGGRPNCPAAVRFDPPPLFGEAIALTHAWVITDTDGAEVRLCWESRHPLPDDYTVFVHLLDATGDLITTGDGPPMEGAFPVSLWEPGDVVLDVHHLTISPSAARINVGLYRPTDGVRLPASLAGSPVPDASVTIWPLQQSSLSGGNDWE